MTTTASNVHSPNPATPPADAGQAQAADVVDVVDVADAADAPVSPAAAAPIDAAQAQALPTSFGVFKPVGHVMMGLPTPAQLEALVAALHASGWPAAALRPFSPSESAAELQAMVDSAGLLAGFGYEITLLRRYAALAAAGYQWLLVQVADGDRAAVAAAAAQDCGATLAVYYRALTVEDLIS